MTPLVRRRWIRAGALATLDPQGGFPFASLVTVATDHDGSPLFLMSRLSAHTLNLETDPRAPRLRLHKLKGRHRDKHAVSLTYSYRIVLIMRIVNAEIVLLDIGSHDDVYRE